VKRFIRPCRQQDVCNTLKSTAHAALGAFALGSGDGYVGVDKADGFLIAFNVAVCSRLAVNKRDAPLLISRNLLVYFCGQYFGFSRGRKYLQSSKLSFNLSATITPVTIPQKPIENPGPVRSGIGEDRERGRKRLFSATSEMLIKCEQSVIMFT
jgi:hypothetical protein